MVSTFTRGWLTLFVLFAAASAGLPAEKDEELKSPSLRTLRTLLGKAPESKEVVVLRKQLRSNPEVTHTNDGFYYSWKEHGLELLFERGTVRAVFLYTAGADEFKQYRGELPEGLHFSDTRRDVEKKLGEPKKRGGSGVIPVWVSYPEKGVTITYVSEDTKDMANRIHHIAIAVIRGK